MQVKSLHRASNFKCILNWVKFDLTMNGYSNNNDANKQHPVLVSESEIHSSNLLMQGANSTSPDDQEHYVCDFCKKVFTSSKGLQIHKGYHEKLASKLDAKIFSRKRKSFDRGFFASKQSNDYDVMPQEMDLFRDITDVNFSFPPNEPVASPSISPKDKVQMQYDQNAKVCTKACSGKNLCEILVLFRKTRMLHRIPKGARRAAADKLSELIDTCISKNDFTSWTPLFMFSYTTLFKPVKNSETSLTTAVKKNISRPKELNSPTVSYHQPMTVSEVSLSKRIEEKVMDGDMKNAMRLLTSKETRAPDTEETFECLLRKHQKPSRAVYLPNPPTELEHVSIDAKSVLNAINSYTKGSAAGLDGIKPQFLKDMLSKRCGESASRLLRSLTNLINFMLAGKLCSDICEFMFGAILIALKKKDGDIRPIAIGNAFRRLAAKIACNKVSLKVGKHLFPKQVGFAVRGGCEAAVHAARKFISSISCPRKVMLKIDLANAFNSLERDAILNAIKYKVPELFPLMWQSYAQPSILLYGSRIIESVVGCQQGDPLGPLGFCLTIHPLVQMIKSEFNVFYIDDGTIGDDYETVIKDFKLFIEESKKLGLSLNYSKCELFIPFKEHRNEIITAFQTIAPSINIVGESDLFLLGSPLTDMATYSILSSKIDTYRLLTDRLKSIHYIYMYMYMHVFLFENLHFELTLTRIPRQQIFDEIFFLFPISFQACLIARSVCYFQLPNFSKNRPTLYSRLLILA